MATAVPHSLRRRNSLSQVLGKLIPRASAAYYATAAAGSGNDTSAITGIAQCHGDIPASDCALQKNLLIYDD